MLGKSDPTRSSGAPGVPISEETKKAVRGAFEAMANWRQDMATQYEQNSSQMFDKMGQAAKAMGWPAEIVDTTRQQMMAMSKMQLQAMDNVMDVWQQQLTSPNPAAAAQAMMQKLTTMPGAGGFGMTGFPGMPGFPAMPGMPGFPGMPGMPTMPGFDMNAMATMNPMQFWMQAAEQWQKNWTNAMQQWAQMQKQTFDPTTSDGRKDPNKKSW